MERFCAFVVAVDVVTDRTLKFGDVGEGASPNCLTGDDAEEDLYHVEPRAARRREMQCDPGILGEPAHDVVVFVGWRSCRR